MHRALQDQMPTLTASANQMLGSRVSQMLVARTCLLVLGPSGGRLSTRCGVPWNHTPTCCRPIVQRDSGASDTGRRPSRCQQVSGALSSAVAQ